MSTMRRYMKAIRDMGGKHEATEARPPADPGVNPYSVSIPPDDPLLVGVYDAVLDAKRLVHSLPFLQGNTDVYLALGLAIYDLRVARKARMDLRELAEGLATELVPAPRRRGRRGRKRA